MGNTRHLLRRRGFTLIEIMITVLIVSIAGLAIISSLIFGIFMRQSIRERNGAMRVAADVIESTKKRLFAELSQTTLNAIVIDDRGTTRDSDDIRGTAVLRLFTTDGTEVGISGSPIPTDRPMLRAEVTVTWFSPGWRGGEQMIVLQTLLAP